MGRQENEKNGDDAGGGSGGLRAQDISSFVDIGDENPHGKRAAVALQGNRLEHEKRKVNWKTKVALSGLVLVVGTAIGTIVWQSSRDNPSPSRSEGPNGLLWGGGEADCDVASFSDFYFKSIFRGCDTLVVVANITFPPVFGVFNVGLGRQVTIRSENPDKPMVLSGASFSVFGNLELSNVIVKNTDTVMVIHGVSATATIRNARIDRTRDLATMLLGGELAVFDSDIDVSESLVAGCAICTVTMTSTNLRVPIGHPIVTHASSMILEHVHVEPKTHPKNQFLIYGPDGNTKSTVPFVGLNLLRPAFDDRFNDGIVKFEEIKLGFSPLKRCKSTEVLSQVKKSISSTFSCRDHCNTERGCVGYLIEIPDKKSAICTLFSSIDIASCEPLDKGYPSGANTFYVGFRKPPRWYTLVPQGFDLDMSSSFVAEHSDVSLDICRTLCRTYAPCTALSYTVEQRSCLLVSETKSTETVPRRNDGESHVESHYKVIKEMDVRVPTLSLLDDNSTSVDDSTGLGVLVPDTLVTAGTKCTIAGLDKVGLDVSIFDSNQFDGCAAICHRHLRNKCEAFMFDSSASKCAILPFLLDEEKVSQMCAGGQRDWDGGNATLYLSQHSAAHSFPLKRIHRIPFATYFHAVEHVGPLLFRLDNVTTLPSCERNCQIVRYCSLAVYNSLSESCSFHSYKSVSSSLPSFSHSSGINGNESSYSNYILLVAHELISFSQAVESVQHVESGEEDFILDVIFGIQYASCQSICAFRSHCVSFFSVPTKTNRSIVDSFVATLENGAPAEPTPAAALDCYLVGRSADRELLELYRGAPGEDLLSWRIQKSQTMNETSLPFEKARHRFGAGSLEKEFVPVQGNQVLPIGVRKAILGLILDDAGETSWCSMLCDIDPQCAAWALSDSSDTKGCVHFDAVNIDPHVPSTSAGDTNDVVHVSVSSWGKENGETNNKRRAYASHNTTCLPSSPIDLLLEKGPISSSLHFSGIQEAQETCRSLCEITRDCNSFLVSTSDNQDVSLKCELFAGIPTKACSSSNTSSRFFDVQVAVEPFKLAALPRHSLCLDERKAPLQKAIATFGPTQLYDCKAKCESEASSYAEACGAVIYDFHTALCTILPTESVHLVHGDECSQNAQILLAVDKFEIPGSRPPTFHPISGCLDSDFTLGLQSVSEQDCLEECLSLGTCAAVSFNGSHCYLGSRWEPVKINSSTCANQNSKVAVKIVPETFVASSNRCPDAEPITTLPALSKDSCASLCVRTKSCSSFTASPCRLFQGHTSNMHCSYTEDSLFVREDGQLFTEAGPSRCMAKKDSAHQLTKPFYGSLDTCKGVCNAYSDSCVGFQYETDSSEPCTLLKDFNGPSGPCAENQKLFVSYRLSKVGELQFRKVSKSIKMFGVNKNLAIPPTSVISEAGCLRKCAALQSKCNAIHYMKSKGTCLLGTIAKNEDSNSVEKEATHVKNVGSTWTEAFTSALPAQNSVEVIAGSKEADECTALCDSRSGNPGCFLAVYPCPQNPQGQISTKEGQCTLYNGTRDLLAGLKGSNVCDNDANVAIAAVRNRIQAFSPRQENVHICAEIGRKVPLLENLKTFNVETQEECADLCILHGKGYCDGFEYRKENQVLGNGQPCTIFKKLEDIEKDAFEPSNCRYSLTLEEEARKSTKLFFSESNLTMQACADRCGGKGATHVEWKEGDSCRCFEKNTPSPTKGSTRPPTPLFTNYSPELNGMPMSSDRDLCQTFNIDENFVFMFKEDSPTQCEFFVCESCGHDICTDFMPRKTLETCNCSYLDPNTKQRLVRDHCPSVSFAQTSATFYKISAPKYSSLGSTDIWLRSNNNLTFLGPGPEREARDWISTDLGRAGRALYELTEETRASLKVIIKRFELLSIATGAALAAISVVSSALANLADTARSIGQTAFEIGKSIDALLNLFKGKPSVTIFLEAVLGKVSKAIQAVRHPLNKLANRVSRILENGFERLENALLKLDGMFLAGAPVLIGIGPFLALVTTVLTKGHQYSILEEKSDYTSSFESAINFTANIVSGLNPPLDAFVSSLSSVNPQHQQPWIGAQITIGKLFQEFQTPLQDMIYFQRAFGGMESWNFAYDTVDLGIFGTYTVLEILETFSFDNPFGFIFEAISDVIASILPDIAAFTVPSIEHLDLDLVEAKLNSFTAKLEALEKEARERLQEPLTITEDLVANLTDRLPLDIPEDWDLGFDQFNAEYGNDDSDQQSSEFLSKPRDLTTHIANSSFSSLRGTENDVIGSLKPRELIPSRYTVNEIGRRRRIVSRRFRELLPRYSIESHNDGRNRPTRSRARSRALASVVDINQAIQFESVDSYAFAYNEADYWSTSIKLRTPAPTYKYVEIGYIRHENVGKSDKVEFALGPEWCWVKINNRGETISEDRKKLGELTFLLDDNRNYASDEYFTLLFVAAPKTKQEYNTQRFKSDKCKFCPKDAKCFDTNYPTDKEFKTALDYAKRHLEERVSVSKVVIKKPDLFPKDRDLHALPKEDIIGFLHTEQVIPIKTEERVYFRKETFGLCALQTAYPSYFTTEIIVDTNFAQILQLLCEHSFWRSDERDTKIFSAFLSGYHGKNSLHLFPGVNKNKLKWDDIREEVDTIFECTDSSYKTVGEMTSGGEKQAIYQSNERCTKPFHYCAGQLKKCITTEEKEDFLKSSCILARCFTPISVPPNSWTVMGKKYWAARLGMNPSTDPGKYEETISRSHKWNVEHILDASRGGGYTFSNFVMTWAKVNQDVGFTFHTEEVAREFWQRMYGEDRYNAVLDTNDWCESFLKATYTGNEDKEFHDISGHRYYKMKVELNRKSKADSTFEPLLTESAKKWLEENHHRNWNALLSHLQRICSY